MSSRAHRSSLLRRESFSCVLCASTEGRRCARGRGWDVLRCAGCGLRRTWPVPDPGLVAGLHDDEAYYGERWMGTAKQSAWAARADEVLGLLGRPQEAVLDFGAGDGGLVAALRAAGVRAEGVESSAAARRPAHGRGVELHEEIPPGADGGFTGVTMLHVLEHLADPVATLERLRRTLRPGGRLLIEVPNAGSIDALRPSVRALVLDLPFHLHHFTPATLTAVVARAGFEPLDLRRFNPQALEWVLARRRGVGPNVPADAAAPAPGAAVAGDIAAGVHEGAAALWHGALPRLRRALPGLKLQLVAGI